jgi:hypothetical protein
MRDLPRGPGQRGEVTEAFGHADASSPRALKHLGDVVRPQLLDGKLPRHGDGSVQAGNETVLVHLTRQRQPAIGERRAS